MIVNFTTPYHYSRTNNVNSKMNFAGAASAIQKGVKEGIQEIGRVLSREEFRTIKETLTSKNAIMSVLNQMEKENWAGESRVDMLCEISTRTFNNRDLGSAEIVEKAMKLVPPNDAKLSASKYGSALTSLAKASNLSEEFMGLVRSWATKHGSTQIAGTTIANCAGVLVTPARAYCVVDGFAKSKAVKPKEL